LHVLYSDRRELGQQRPHLKYMKHTTVTDTTYTR
jgi:hypothetical protein